MFVIIAGAGVIGTNIAKMLSENKHDVIVIDYDREVCETIYAETGIITINGNATDIKTLEEAGAHKADILLASMLDDADNLACILLAKSLEIPRIVACLRKPRYERAYNLSGATAIVSSTDLLLNQIMMEIEQPEVKKIISINRGKADIYAVKVSEKAKAQGMSIMDLTSRTDFPKECLFIGIFKDIEGDFLIPRGKYVISSDDTLFLVSKSQYIKQATQFFL